MRGKRLIFSEQNSILSAASIIMVMIVFSKILGLVRQRVLLSFFVPDELSLFFAAFRFPDLVFEVLTMGTLSSAFIPVFTKLFKKDQQLAWKTAGRMLNLGLLIFALISIVFGIFAEDLYRIVAPGFSPEQTEKIGYLARVLFAAQGFFVISYILTGVLESLRRFLIPALAPLFYNLGIIAGTVLFSSRFHLLAPSLGVLMGAFAHFLIQLPLSYKLGFRFEISLRPTKEVKKIGRLAMPRIFELSVLQISKTVELFLASLISTASYTYYTLANSVQLIPVGLFGVSLAKAALPTLTSQSDDLAKFKSTFFSTLYQVVFLVMPIAGGLIVFRIPIVRLLFGTDIFDWEATVQTGLVLSAFALGVPFQAAVMLLNRAFYALNDTKTPVFISLIGTTIAIIFSFIGILLLDLPTWALSASFSSGVIVQSILLFYILSNRINGGVLINLYPFFKTIVSSLVSSGVMYFILKFFDRSVWVKRLSFLGSLDAHKRLDFEKFVLDTRYTTNLLILTLVTFLVGGVFYFLAGYLLRSQELFTLTSLIKRRKKISSPPIRESETVSPSVKDNTEF